MNVHFNHGPQTHRAPLDPVRIITESLLLAAVALLLLNFHPFGRGPNLHRYSQDLLYSWFGDHRWLYPKPPPLPARPPSTGRVVAVLIDEKSLALRSASWPAPLGFHAQILSELGVLQPRAIMLDFLLIDPAPAADSCALLATAASLRRDGVLLYLAVLRAEDFLKMADADCEDQDAHPLRFADVFIPVSVHRQADDSDFVTRRYPFADRPNGASSSTNMLSAAVRMYCDQAPSVSNCAVRLTRGREEGDGFELAWSPTGDPFNQQWSSARCDVKGNPFAGSVGRPALPLETSCPSIATLFASELISPSLGPDNGDLIRLIQGSFVFVGGNFRGSGDLMTTPMHTLLPGVYYHATALENLLAFKGYPKIRREFRHPKLAFYAFDLAVLWVLAAIFLVRQNVVGESVHAASPLSVSALTLEWLAKAISRVPPWLWKGAVAVVCLLAAAYQVAQLAAFIAVILAVLAIEFRLAVHGDLRGRLRSIAYYIGALALSVLVVAIAAAIGYRFLALPPGDWIGYLSFVAFGFFIADAAIVEFSRQVGDLRGHRASSGQQP